MNLWQDFLTNDLKIISRWTHYFLVCERHFSGWRNESLTFIERTLTEAAAPAGLA
jgi:hypothetical protein